jgi:hypothetical protein
MLDTYIKNRGMTKTIIHKNNKNKVSEIKWDADYDGAEANVSLNVNNDGFHDKYHFTLDNEDLANMLNINSVSLPLEERIKRDFNHSVYKPNQFQIELDAPPLIPISPPYRADNTITIREEPITHKSLSEKELFSPVTHLSSPKQNEEFIIPMTIDDKTVNNFTFTPRKYHRRRKTHKTHRVYKRRKTSRVKSQQNSRKSKKSSIQYTYL